MHLGMKDQDVFSSFVAYAKSAGQRAHYGYPYSVGGEMRFQAGNLLLHKKGKEFAVTMSGIPMIDYCNSEEFVNKCQTLTLKASGLREDELEIP